MSTPHMPTGNCEMADERLDQRSEVSDGEATLRDGDHILELSAADIEPVDSTEPLHAALQGASEPDEETTQVLERSQLDLPSDADATDEDLRKTVQSELSDSMTTEHKVPEALLERLAPETQQMHAVGTQPLPRVADCEETAERSIDSGEWAEIDDEGFYTLIARADAEGRVKLPEALLEGEGGHRVKVFLRVKKL